MGGDEAVWILLQQLWCDGNQGRKAGGTVLLLMCVMEDNVGRG